jgi:hypothetical protein
MLCQARLRLEWSIAILVYLAGTGIYFVVIKLLLFIYCQIRDYSISCILKVMIFFPNFMLIHVEQFLKVCPSQLVSYVMGFCLFDCSHSQ